MTLVNLHSKLKVDGSYKLIQLTPDLLKAIEKEGQSPDETGLEFKTLDVTSKDKHKNEVVLCSSDKTWLLRQKNHSNTVMLLKQYEPEQEIIIPEHLLFGAKGGQPSVNLMGFSKTTYEYETNLITGKISLDMIPIYDGELDFGSNFGDNKREPLRTIDDLVANSACSRKECLKEWHQVGGTIVNGYLCLPSEAFMSQALHVTLVSILGGSCDMEKLTLPETYKLVTNDIEDEYNPYTLDVIRSVLNKFGLRLDNEDGEYWKLNMDIIAKWYGKLALHKYASKHSVAIDEFLIKWKSLFPPFFVCDIDVTMLRGSVYRPTSDSIQYISRAILPLEPKDRFKTLFKLQSSWLLEDISPFVEELNIRGLKLDNFIMKYARRRRVPNPNNRKKMQVIVTSR